MKLPRMIWWTVAAVALGGLVAWQSPAQLTVVAYKAFLVTLAAVGAHLLDRTFFREPTSSDEIARAIVFAAVVVGFTAGL
ncbi:MAG: hypothetical protein E4H01_12170 [Lysobacterales bacterium]|nr:MAG: hypothetical protein E4H01_12170 [Xanthomonadales bacterium]